MIEGSRRLRECNIECADIFSNPTVLMTVLTKIQKGLE